jgi:hypothetical protein
MYDVFWYRICQLKLGSRDGTFTIRISRYELRSAMKSDWRQKKSAKRSGVVEGLFRTSTRNDSKARAHDGAHHNFDDFSMRAVRHVNTRDPTEGLWSGPATRVLFSSGPRQNPRHNGDVKQKLFVVYRQK